MQEFETQAPLSGNVTSSYLVNSAHYTRRRTACRSVCLSPKLFTDQWICDNAKGASEDIQHATGINMILNQHFGAEV
jgi:hypothetical protein